MMHPRSQLHPYPSNLTLFLPDSKLTNVPIGILTSERKTDPPSIVLDNVQASNVGILVRSEEGNTLLAGKTPLDSRSQANTFHVNISLMKRSRWNHNCVSLGCWPTL